MPARESEVLVGRRYLERNFLDTAMRLFVRNAPLVPQADWQRLVDGLMDRQRISDVIEVCRLGEVALPRERILSIGDAALRRRDVENAKHFYEVAEADTERWSRLLDVLIAVPDRERLALEIAARYLPASPAVAPLAAAS